MTDQIHCLYEYDLGSGAAPGKLYPLEIVRGSDIAAHFPVEPDPSFPPYGPNTSLVVNQSGGALMNDPDEHAGALHWYVGAVNQMGIHIHWHAPDGASPPNPTHYYARDMFRTFDEDIDENTLVTDQCTVSNGTAHGGYVGAYLDGGHRMTVWTDPNYGPPSKDGTSGLYSPRTVPFGPSSCAGTLSFSGDQVNLGIGFEGAPQPGTVLTVGPLFYFFFQGNGQGVTINALSTFDYYGLIATHDANGNNPVLGTPFFGSGTIDLEGLGGYMRETQLACLNVHGGADLSMANELISNYGQINVLFEPSMYPTTSGSQNPSATGHMTLLGQTSIGSGSYVIGNAPAGTTSNIITVEHGYGDAGNQFDVEGSSLSNNDPDGASAIQIDGNAGPFWPVLLSGDVFTAIKLHIENPYSGGNTNAGNVTIENCGFNEMHGRTIFIENTLCDPTDQLSQYTPDGVITISGNSFEDINPNLDADDASHGTFGIYIAGIDWNYNGGDKILHGTLQVDDNFFTTVDNFNNVYPNYATMDKSAFNPLIYSAAICFENTTGDVNGNFITDPGYTKGIWLHGTEYQSIWPTTKTLICTDTIEHLHPADERSDYRYNDGILTENHNGWTKLSNISDDAVGYSATGNALCHSFLDFNLIDNFNVSNPSLLITPISVSGSSILDLSGAHSDNADGGVDYGGYNTVRAYHTVAFAPASMVMLYNATSLINLGNSFATWAWTDYGHNNFYYCESGNCNTSGDEDDLWFVNPYAVQYTIPLGNIDYNYWGLDDQGVLIDPHNGTSAYSYLNWSSSNSTTENATGITFDYSSTSNTLTSLASKTGI
ncbi:MAG: hypothetical protein ACREBW_05415, partial [Candidatus Micrarchaeaceae archaeon]